MCFSLFMDPLLHAGSAPELILVGHSHFSVSEMSLIYLDFTSSP